MSDKNIDKDIEILKEHIKELDEEKVLYGGFLSRKQAIENVLSELEIKDKMIDLMVEFIDGLNDNGEYDMFCYLIHGNNCNGYKEDRSKDKCKNCIKEYFRNEVEKDA